jgi:hypothetical protein
VVNPFPPVRAGGAPSRVAGGAELLPGRGRRRRPGRPGGGARRHPGRRCVLRREGRRPLGRVDHVRAGPRRAPGPVRCLCAGDTKRRGAHGGGGGAARMRVCCGGREWSASCTGRACCTPPAPCGSAPCPAQRAQRRSRGMAPARPPPPPPPPPASLPSAHLTLPRPASLPLPTSLPSAPPPSPLPAPPSLPPFCPHAASSRWPRSATWTSTSTPTKTATSWRGGCATWRRRRCSTATRAASCAGTAGAWARVWGGEGGRVIGGRGVNGGCYVSDSVLKGGPIPTATAHAQRCLAAASGQDCVQRRPALPLVQPPCSRFVISPLCPPTPQLPRLPAPQRAGRDAGGCAAGGRHRCVAAAGQPVDAGPLPHRRPHAPLARRHAAARAASGEQLCASAPAPPTAPCGGPAPSPAPLAPPHSHTQACSRPAHGPADPVLAIPASPVSMCHPLHLPPLSPGRHPHRHLLRQRARPVLRLRRPGHAGSVHSGEGGGLAVGQRSGAHGRVAGRAAELACCNAHASRLRAACAGPACLLLPLGWAVQELTASTLPSWPPTLRRAAAWPTWTAPTATGPRR